MNKVSSLRSTYHQFKRVSCTITLQNNKIYPNKNWHLDSLDISLCTKEKCNSAILVFHCILDNDEIFKTLESGAKAVIKLGYEENESVVFSGYLHTMEVQAIPNHIQKVELYLQDVRGLMMLNRSFRYTEERKLQELVQSILKKKTYQSYVAKTKIDTIDKSLNVPSLMSSLSDYDYLNEMAELCGYEFFVDKDTLKFTKYEHNNGVKLQFDDRDAIVYFTLLTNLQSLIGTAKVVSVNENGEKKVAEESISYTSYPQSKVIKNTLNDAIFYKTLNDISLHSQAQQYAKALKQKAMQNYAHFSGKSVLIPELNIGEIIEVNDFPDGKVKKVYLQEVRHVIQAEESFSEWEGYLI